MKLGHRASHAPLHLPLHALLVLALTMPGAALANSEIEQLRAEFEQKLKALQQQYEARLKKLEAGEERLASQPTQPMQPVTPPAAPAPLQAASTAATAFNPEISLVLQGAYLGQKNIQNRQINGFMPAAPDHAHDGGERGFTLGHSELTLSANIDPMWRGHANFSVEDDAVNVEEAWFQSTSLGNGLSLRGGRFLSGIGYANEQHPHAWDFSDASLLQRVLFGENLRQDGVQLKWLMPSDSFREFGIEVGRGQSFPGSPAGGNRNGAASWAAFAHSGDDIGLSHSWRAGLSYLASQPRLREAHLEDTAGIEAKTTFSGKSSTWLADFVWKWAPDGNAREQYLKLQAEAFRRVEHGELGCADNRAEGGACNGTAGDYQSRQHGWYAQAVYQFMHGWRTGYRYDRLNPGRVEFSALPLATMDHRPTRHSLMTDYSPSEFSRFRLQLAYDKAMSGVIDRQVTLQYIHSLGAHGAHRY